MDHHLILFFAVFHFWSASFNSDFKADRLDVGRMEAARLRASYNLHQSREKNESGREMGLFYVPGTDLSDEARAAGFCSAGIDADMEILTASEDEDGAEGLVFDWPSGVALWRMRDDFGYSFEPTNQWDILRYKVRFDQVSEPTDTSLPGPASPEPRHP